MNHPLLFESKRRSAAKQAPPADASYSFSEGLWLTPDGCTWVSLGLPGPQTKKMDVESGEDAKAD